MLEPGFVYLFLRSFSFRLHFTMTISTTSYLPLSELTRRATIDKKGIQKYSVKMLISTAGKLFDEVNMPRYFYLPAYKNNLFSYF